MGLTPLVSIIIPTHNRKERLIRLINSIKRNTYSQDKIEIIVIDDASSDQTLEIVKRSFPNVKIMRNDVELFPSACRNLGIGISRGDLIFFVDDDVVLDKDAINELVKILTKYEDIGLVGLVMYYYKNPAKIWCAGVRLFPPIFYPPYLLKKDKRRWELSENLLIECDSIPSAFMTKRTVIEQVGLFDERLPIGWEETDFALRIKKKGYRIVIYTSAKAFHDLPTISEIHITEKRVYWAGRNTVLFYRKHAFIRCLLLHIDITAFILFLLKNNKSVKKFLPSYIKGIKHGLSFHINYLNRSLLSI
jgi:hypothetical protein